MTALALALALLGADLDERRSCPAASKPYVALGPRPCKTCLPSRILQCAPLQKNTEVVLPKSYGTENLRLPERVFPPVGTPRIEDVPLVPHRRRLLSRGGIDSVWQRAGKPMTKKTPSPRREDSIWVAEQLGWVPEPPKSASFRVTPPGASPNEHLRGITAIRVSKRFLGVTQNRKVFAFDSRDPKLRPVEGAPTVAWGVEPLDDGRSFLYIAQDGGLYRVDVIDASVTRVSPDAESGEKVSPFYEVLPRSRVVYLQGRNNGIAEIYAADLRQGTHDLLTTIRHAKTVTFEQVANTDRVIMHAGIPTLQIVAELNVTTKKVRLITPPMPSWGNLHVSPTGRFLVFGVCTKNVQPRTYNTYRVDLD